MPRKTSRSTPRHATQDLAVPYLSPALTAEQRERQTSMLSLEQKVRSASYYDEFGYPAAGVIPVVKTAEVANADAQIWMTRLEDMLDHVKYKWDMTARQMIFVPAGQVLRMFKPILDMTMIEHDHFDPLPNEEAVRITLKKKWGHARAAPYEKRHKRAFTKSPKRAQKRA